MKKNQINIEEKIKEFDNLIAQLSDTRRKEIELMMEKIGERYFTSPASYKTELHNCFGGGLLIHSLCTVKNLKEICGLWYSEASADSMITVGLFHDLGKIGAINGEMLYIPVSETWKVQRGQLYDYNKNIKDGLTHAQRSARLLSYFQVSLTDEEYIALLFHDGLYKTENICFNNTCTKLALLLHWADHWATVGEKL